MFAPGAEVERVIKHRPETDTNIWVKRKYNKKNTSKEHRNGIGTIV